MHLRERYPVRKMPDTSKAYRGVRCDFASLHTSVTMVLEQPASNTHRFNECIVCRNELLKRRRSFGRIGRLASLLRLKCIGRFGLLGHYSGLRFGATILAFRSSR